MRLGTLLLVAVVAGCLTPVPSSDSKPEAPVVTFEAVAFETTVGPFTILLYPESAPKTVALVKTYVEEGYYVGREFNRVVPGHVIQLVDRAGGATDDPRRVPLETHADYHFSAGAAGIARSEDPNSGGPEFFVMDFATSHLDGNFTVWGQVVTGIDTVHKAARVPGLDARPHPAVPLLVTDRVAIEPPTITSAKLAIVELPAEEAATFPLRVASNVRAGEFRHSLDWPASIAPGGSSDLTWYMRPYNGTAPPGASSVRIHVDGTELPVVEDPHAPGAYGWVWTPSREGTHEATLVAGGTALATLRIAV